jgi:hypothetical protein
MQRTGLIIIFLKKILLIVSALLTAYRINKHSLLMNRLTTCIVPLLVRETPGGNLFRQQDIYGNTQSYKHLIPNGIGFVSRFPLYNILPLNLNHNPNPNLYPVK